VRNDDLPYRIREEALPDPPVSGRKLNRRIWDTMLDEYYRLRGWGCRRRADGGQAG